MSTRLAGLTRGVVLTLGAIAHFAGSALSTPAARAEVAEVALAQQFGIIFAPLMVMERLKLVEKHAAAKGMPDLKVNWTKLSGPAVMVDAMLSGNLHFSSQGLPSTALLWDRTRNGVGVKAISSINASPIFLNTRNPNIKSLKDFTDKDRIALPSIKVSSQAIYLQIAAEKAFGPGKHAQLDHLAVALSHPDAVAAVMNPASEIATHFATSPFHEVEKKAGFSTITSSYEIMGGESSILTFISTEKFRTENPKVYAIVVAAFEEAMDYSNADMRRLVKLYAEVANDKKNTEDELHAIVTQPGFKFSRAPATVGAMTEFMHKIGLIKNKPVSWKDLFFSEAHGLPGN
jgi:NitT/TauT family transport system substrate-binding protein